MTTPFRRRIRVCDREGVGIAELEGAVPGPVALELNKPASWTFAMSLYDPKVPLLLDKAFREVQLFVGSWLVSWGPVVDHVIADGKITFTAFDALWFLGRRHLSEELPNRLTNGDFSSGDSTIPGWTQQVNRGGIYGADDDEDASYIVSGAEGPTADSYGVQQTAVYGTPILWQEFTVTAGPFGLEVYAEAFSRIFAPGLAGDALVIARLPVNYRNVVDPGLVPPAVRPTDRQGDLDFYAGRAGNADARISKTQITPDTPVGAWIRHRTSVTVPPNTTETIHVRLCGRTPHWPVAQAGWNLWDTAGAWVDDAFEFHGDDVAEAVAVIVDHANAIGSSWLNLITDNANTGRLLRRRYRHADRVKALDALVGLANEGILDFWLDVDTTTRRVKIAHPRRAEATDHVLELGGNVGRYRYTFSGQEAASEVTALSGTDAGSAWGRWTENTDFADGVILERTVVAPENTPLRLLSEVAREELLFALEPSTLSLTLNDRGRALIGVLRLGDLVRVRIDDGPLHVDRTYRVTKLTLTPGDVLEVEVNRELEEPDDPEEIEL